MLLQTASAIYAFVLPLCCSLIGAEPAVVKSAQPDKYIAANGRRAALLGFEDGRMGAWIFPIKLFRDLRMSVYVDGALDPAPLAGLTETAEVQASHATLTHSHHAGAAGRLPGRPFPPVRSVHSGQDRHPG